jgi:glucose/arabinose dehydrogenase
MKKWLPLFPLILLIQNLSCDEIGKKILKIYKPNYETEQKILQSKPIFNGADENRNKIAISLNEVFQIKEPTDIQFPPHDSKMMFLLEKNGTIIVVNRSNKKSRKVIELKVVTDSEEGLLGLAFHPNFPKSPLVYLNYNITKTQKDLTIISEWILENPQDLDSMKFTKERILLEVEQPFPNHNGGQLAFGKDGYLYIGLGDGGLRGDPKNNGQNTKTMLGSMLRIDPKPNSQLKQPYTIPSTNPFINSKDHLPEIFAYGLRNPWRYSFSPDGRLIVADVGQDKFEEIDIIESGKNYGWSEKEGFHCYNSNCQLNGFSDPIYEYDRSEGQSITGGYVYSANDFPELKGKYIFGDFISGRIWAMELPSINGSKTENKVESLGKWNVLISTFGRDNEGNIFVADYQSGKIFKIIKQVSK